MFCGRTTLRQRMTRTRFSSRQFCGFNDPAAVAMEAVTVRGGLPSMGIGGGIAGDGFIVTICTHHMTPVEGVKFFFTLAADKNKKPDSWKGFLFLDSF